jgi:hypothetical protein
MNRTDELYQQIGQLKVELDCSKNPDVSVENLR